MTDLSNEKTPISLAQEKEGELEPKSPLRLASVSTNKPEHDTAPRINNPQVDIPDQESTGLAKAPVPAPLPAPAKVTFTSEPTKSVAKHDSSISIDEDEDTSPNIKLFIVDALVAAVAIAFTVLILQDSLPFLK